MPQADPIKTLDPQIVMDAIRKHSNTKSVEIHKPGTVPGLRTNLAVRFKNNNLGLSINIKDKEPEYLDVGLLDNKGELLLLPKADKFRDGTARVNLRGLNPILDWIRNDFKKILEMSQRKSERWETASNRIAQRFIQASMEMEAKVSIQDFIRRFPKAPRTKEEAMKILLDAAKKIGADKILKVIEDLKKRQSILVKNAGIEEIIDFINMHKNSIPWVVAGAIIALMLFGGIDSATKSLENFKTHYQQTGVEPIDTSYGIQHT